MTVKQLSDTLSLKPISIPNGDREVGGAYIGDLLSWVMGRAKQDDAWITIMSNRNIIAVASLADLTCIILAEGVEPDDGVAELALDKGINLLVSPLSAYDLAISLRDAL